MHSHATPPTRKCSKPSTDHNLEADELQDFEATNKSQMLESHLDLKDVGIAEAPQAPFN